MEQYSQDQLTDLELEFDNDVRQQFSDAAKWAKLTSIIMFSFIGIVLLAVIAGGAAILSAFSRLSSSFSILAGQEGAVFLGIFIIVLIGVGIVYYLLFNFANKIKVALLSEHIETMNAGLASLKIFLIITAIFSGLSLLITIYNIFKFI